MPTDPETGKWRPEPWQRTLPPEDAEAEAAEIERAAEVAEDDADAGAEFWRENAPADMAGLIDATEAPPDDA